MSTYRNDAPQAQRHPSGIFHNSPSQLHRHRRPGTDAPEPSRKLRKRTRVNPDVAGLQGGSMRTIDTETSIAAPTGAVIRVPPESAKSLKEGSDGNEIPGTDNEISVPDKCRAEQIAMHPRKRRRRTHLLQLCL